MRQWVGQVNQAMKNLRMDPAFSQRDVNAGFSGGEKKRFEILQMELLRPRFAVLDETDSGLDVDALRVVSEGVNRLHDESDAGFLLITHYTRILRYIKPDYVHVFVDGRVAEAAAPTWPTVWRKRATTATWPDRPHSCRSRRRRVAQRRRRRPTHEQGVLRFFVTSARSRR